MANVVTIHKRDNKQNVKKYRPVLLLPNFRKIFKVLYTIECTHFFTENGLISPNQSGFKQGDSFINKFLSITHDI